MLYILYSFLKRHTLPKEDFTVKYKTDSKVPAKNVLISLYVESRPKLNFRGYLIFKQTFKDSKPQRILFFVRLLTAFP